jgi:hypothetical protein
MHLVDHDDVIEQLAPTSSDPTLSDPVLPRRTKRYPLGCRPDRCDRVDDRPTEELVSIEDEVLRSRIERERFSDLLHDPARRWCIRDVEMNDLSTMMTDYDEHIEYAKGRGEDGEEVHRGDDFAVVLQERFPLLTSSAAGRQIQQAPRHRPLGDIDSEHEQLSMDPLRSPSIVVAHAIDQIANLALNPRSPARAARTRGPLPKQPKALAMPAYDCRRLHDHQGRRPTRPQLTQDHPERAVE